MKKFIYKNKQAFKRASRDLQTALIQLGASKLPIRLNYQDVTAYTIGYADRHALLNACQKVEKFTDRELYDFRLDHELSTAELEKRHSLQKQLLTECLANYKLPCSVEEIATLWHPTAKRPLQDVILKDDANAFMKNGGLDFVANKLLDPLSISLGDIENFRRAMMALGRKNDALLANQLNNCAIELLSKNISHKQVSIAILELLSEFNFKIARLNLATALIDGEPTLNDVERSLTFFESVEDYITPDERADFIAYFLNKSACIGWRDIK